MDAMFRAWLHFQSSSPLCTVWLFRVMLLCLGKSKLIHFLVTHDRKPLQNELLRSRGKDWRLLQLCFICSLKEWYCALCCPGRDSSTKRRFPNSAFFQKAADWSEMEGYSMFLSFGRSESRVLQARQCFRAALGKETELSPKEQSLLSVFFHPDTCCRALHTSWDRKPASCHQGSH